MTVRVFVCFLLPTDWEKEGKTVSDAAVMWAGRKVKVEKEMGTRGSDGVHREVADSERKISKKR